MHLSPLNVGVGSASRRTVPRPREGSRGTCRESGLLTSSPPTGATPRDRSPRGASLMPRPLAMVDYCYDNVIEYMVRHRVSYIGTEPERETLKYRWPANHEGGECPMSEVCNAGKTSSDAPCSKICDAAWGESRILSHRATRSLVLSGCTTKGSQPPWHTCSPCGEWRERGLRRPGASTGTTFCPGGPPVPRGHQARREIGPHDRGTSECLNFCSEAILRGATWHGRDSWRGLVE